jgi:uncharacterized PurR-regulated membrane protein YhhQ (DUF165 family)
MKYAGTLGYLTFIFLVNILFPIMPIYKLWGSPFSGCDILVGVIYILRDFSQREIGRKVLYVMLIGCAASYFFAIKQIVLASICSFIAGETIDWAIYTFSQRLLSSSLISVPIDSALFLFMINQLNIAGFLVMTGAKMCGIFCVWLGWKWRDGNYAKRTVNAYPQNV